MAVADVDLDALPTPGSLIDGQVQTKPTDEIYPHLYAANGKLTHEVPLGGSAARPRWTRPSGPPARPSPGGSGCHRTTGAS
jgi:hypothetical protein